jgi:thiamine biosynthesis protein ThiS
LRGTVFFIATVNAFAKTGSRVRTRVQGVLASLCVTGYPKSPTMITIKGQEYPWRERLPVQDVLEQRGLGNRLVYVRVNGTRIGRSEWSTYAIPDGASVDILPVVLGG